MHLSVLNVRINTPGRNIKAIEGQVKSMDDDKVQDWESYQVKKTHI